MEAGLTGTPSSPPQALGVSILKRFPFCLAVYLTRDEVSGREALCLASMLGTSQTSGGAGYRTAANLCAQASWLDLYIACMELYVS